MPLRRNSPAGDEQGFTLIELLVAMVIGLVVSSAAFAILDTSLKQSTRTADRISANQRGRVAMEKIILKLHSSCVAPETTPVEPESNGTKLLIVSQTGSEASLAKVTLHKLTLEEGKLTDTSYPNTEAKPAPNWEFSKVASNIQILLTGVTQSENSKTKETIPLFQYYKYEGTELSKTPLGTPLKEAEADATAAITVSFTAAPESGTVGKIAGDRTVDLADTAVLRFRPASASGSNLPCA
jgi:prepilin-type N-terminal cleavage/methylation domain-containing protein